MAENKTVATNVDVDDFLAAVPDETRREDATTLVKLLRKITGWKPRMWGPTIIGFGVYQYKYDSGRSGSMCVVGFSPRKGKQVIYTTDFPEKAGWLKKLGKHKTGQQCIYITKLADVDLNVLEQIVAGGVKQVKQDWPVSPG